MLKCLVRMMQLSSISIRHYFFHSIVIIKRNTIIRDLHLRNACQTTIDYTNAIRQCHRFSRQIPFLTIFCGCKDRIFSRIVFLFGYVFPFFIHSSNLTNPYLNRCVGLLRICFKLFIFTSCRLSAKNWTTLFLKTT